MTTQLLATELTNLIQESKRKHNDLRQAGCTACGRFVECRIWSLTGRSGGREVAGGVEGYSRSERGSDHSWYF
jgi:hypothetical protein